MSAVPCYDDDQREALKHPTKITFVLSKKAKNKGGDKYVAENDETFNIYFPQSISRTDDDDEPKQKITINIT